LDEAELPSIANHMADEVKVNSVTDDTFLVIATSPFPALVSYVGSLTATNLPKII
jgi:hypothetical protein